MVRMAAIAIIDVESGRIEALAGALSPCTRQEYDGPGRAANCDKRLPYPIRYRPGRAAEPRRVPRRDAGVVVKPVMAAAFLSDPNVGARWLAAERAAMQSHRRPTRDSLRGQLMRSNSARFLDRMFCGDRKLRACARPWEIQAAANAFGWNADCARRRASAAASATCCSDARGVRSRGRRRTRVGRWIPYGRLLVEPADATSSARRFACASAVRARRRESEAMRRRPRRPTREQTTTGKSAAAASSSTSWPKAGDRACARDRARRRGHDGRARRGRERPDRRAQAASRRAVRGAGSVPVALQLACADAQPDGAEPNAFRATPPK